MTGTGDGGDETDLLRQATRNLERSRGLPPGALDELLRLANRYRIDAVRGLLGTPFADFYDTPHGCLAAGTAVTYQGSLTAEHGRWSSTASASASPARTTAGAAGT